MSDQKKCVACDGTGKTSKGRRCPPCNGTGTQQQEERKEKKS